VKAPQKASQTIDFESGDCLIFNGGTEYNIFHGITEIIDNTCPEYFPEKYLHSRISLQFRQTLRNDNHQNFGCLR